MDPLTAIGAVASIAQLAQTAISLSKTLYSLGAALASASDDIRALADDLKTFAQSLTLLSRLLEDSKSWYSDDVYLLTAKIIKDCAELYVKIDKILIKLGGNGQNKWKTRLKFVYKEGEIRKLMKRLRDMKGTLATILMSLQVDLQLSLLNISSASKLQRAPDKPLLPETIESLMDAQEAVEASKAMSHHLIRTEQVVQYSKTGFGMVSSRVEELTGILPLTKSSGVSVCSKEAAHVVPRNLDTIESPKAPNEPSSSGILSSLPQIPGKIKPVQGFNTNAVDSSRFHTMAFVVQPPISNNEALMVTAKSKTKSLKFSSSSDSFKSAVSEQNINNDLAKEIKAVQSVMHAFRSALELVGKLIQNRIATNEEDLYFAARDLESSLADGETEIEATHKSHCKQHGYRYVESFTDSHKTELQNISSVLMRKVVTVLHIYSAEHEDLQKSKLESLYWCSERCRGHTLNQIAEVASALQPAMPSAEATGQVSDVTHFSSENRSEPSSLSMSTVATSGLLAPLRGVSPVQSESDKKQYEEIDTGSHVKISKMRRASRPKVKTGCNNCKNRRVKCDESRPICIKCVRSGRQCDGYPAYRRVAGLAIPIVPRFLIWAAGGAATVDIEIERKKLPDLTFWEDRVESTGAPLHKSFKERAMESQGRVPSLPRNNDEPSHYTSNELLERGARMRPTGSGVQDPMPEMEHGESDSDATTDPSIACGPIEGVQTWSGIREPNSIDKVHRHRSYSSVSGSSHDEPLEHIRTTLHERPYEFERYNKATEYYKRPDSYLRATIIRQKAPETQQAIVQEDSPLPEAIHPATRMQLCGTARPAERNEEYYYRREVREFENTRMPFKDDEAKPDAASKVSRWPIKKRSPVSDDLRTNFGEPRIETGNNRGRHRSYLSQSAAIGSSRYDDTIRPATSDEDVDDPLDDTTVELVRRLERQDTSRLSMSYKGDINIAHQAAPYFEGPRRAGSDILASGLASAAVAGLYEHRLAKKDQKEDNIKTQGSWRRSWSRSRSAGVGSNPIVDPELGMVEYGDEPVYPAHDMTSRDDDIERDDRNSWPRSRFSIRGPSSSDDNHRYRSQNRSPIRDPTRTTIPSSAGAAAIGINQYMERKERKEAERERRREEADISRFQSASSRISSQRKDREPVILVPGVDDPSSDRLGYKEPVIRLPEPDQVERPKLIGGLRRVSPAPDDYETSEEDPSSDYASDAKDKRGILEAVAGGLAGNLIVNEARPHETNNTNSKGSGRSSKPDSAVLGIIAHADEKSDIEKGKAKMSLERFLRSERLGSWNDEMDSLSSLKSKSSPVNQIDDMADVKPEELSMIPPRTDIAPDRIQDFDFDSFLRQDGDELDQPNESPTHSSGNTAWQRLPGSKFPSWTGQAPDKPLRTLLPVEEPPNSVNAKQFERIRKRRIARHELEMKFAAERERRKPRPRPTGPQPCFRRPRGPGGRFLTPNEIASIQKVDGETDIAPQKPLDSSSGPANVSEGSDVTMESGQRAPAMPNLKLGTALGLEVAGLAATAAAKYAEEHKANHGQMGRGRSRTRSGSRTRDDDKYRYGRGRIRDKEYSDDSDFVVKEMIIRRACSRSVSPHHKRHLAEGALAGAGAATLLANHRDKSGTATDNHGRQVIGGAAYGAIGAEVLTRARSGYRESQGGANSRSRSRGRPSKSPDSALEVSLPFIGYTFKRFDSKYAEFERVRLLNEKAKQDTSASTKVTDVPKFDFANKEASNSPLNRPPSPKSHFKSCIASPGPLRKDSDSALTQPQPKGLWWQAFFTLQTLHLNTFVSLSKELGSEAGIFPPDIPTDDVICTRMSSLTMRLWTCMHEDKPSLAPIMAIREDIIKVIITIHQQLGLEIATLAWSCAWVFLSIHEYTFSATDITLTNPQIEQITLSFQHLQDIVGIIARYAVMENLYAQNPSLTLHPEYQAALLDLCVTTLTYFDAAFAAGRKAAEGIMSEEQGTVDALVQEIKGKDKACQNFSVVIEARDECESESEEADVEDVSDESWEQVTGDEADVDISPN